jgi:hypothetical protein
MTMTDLIMLISGTILGFGASIGAIKYQEFEKRKRAINILNIELYKIDKLLSSLVQTDRTLKLPSGEIVPFNDILISTTEILNFKMVMQIDVFLCLNDKLRKLIYEISLGIECAEDNRKLAIPLLKQKGKENELDMHGLMYIECLKSAKENTENLKKKLN